LYANGGGFRYGLKFTGGVAPFEPSGTERVQIVDEKLDIKLHERDAEVRVRYMMKNISKKRANVRFGFPVDVTEPMYYGKDQKVSAKTMSERAARYCRDYHISADGKAVAHSQELEPFALGKLKQFRGSELIKGIGAWQVSTLIFAPGQQRAIEISYGAEHFLVGSTTSNDSRLQPPVFRYRLSTGGVWAGPIAKGRVRVTLGDDVDPKWIEFKAPAGRFRRDGEAWVWNFTDLEPTLADDIQIVAGPQVSNYSAGGNGAAFYVIKGVDLVKTKKGQRDKGWQYRHKLYSVEASSTLPAEQPYTYTAGNLKNWDWVTDHDENSYSVWSEGAKGHGIGESLTLTVEKPLPLDAIEIYPGHGRNEILFKANSRPSKLKVVLNGEHAFVANLRDVNLTQKIAIAGYSKPVKTVKVEIADVYPGWQYEDTCISDLALVSPLKQEPLRYGAR
jgi:hypothetical protein